MEHTSEESMAEQDWETFRTLLKEVWNDPLVRKRIEQRTDIAPRTLSRWISGETEEPDRKRLFSLLIALPQHRDALLAAIRRAIPDFEIPLIDPATRLTEDLPVSFWIRLHEANAMMPPNLHFTAIVDLILLQLQATIDPEYTGVQLIIAHCSPPASPAHPVRSLREVMHMTTHQSLLTDPGDILFLGAESLCGYSASLCQACIVQNTDEEQRLPVRRSRNERSAAAYPIQRGGAVAGVFLVSSPQPDFFSQRLQDLLQVYAHLLGLAFETDRFYPPERIRLRLMPAETIQRAYILGFQQQVISLLQGNPSLSRREAEAAAGARLKRNCWRFHKAVTKKGDDKHARTY
jgi:GAF domain